MQRNLEKAIKKICLQKHPAVGIQTVEVSSRRPPDNRVGVHNSTLQKGTLQSGSLHNCTLQNVTFQNNSLQTIQLNKTVRGTKRHVTERYSYIMENVTKWYSIKKRYVTGMQITRHNVSKKLCALVQKMSMLPCDASIGWECALTFLNLGQGEAHTTELHPSTGQLCSVGCASPYPVQIQVRAHAQLIHASVVSHHHAVQIVTNKIPGAGGWLCDNQVLIKSAWMKNLGSDFILYMM